MSKRFIVLYILLLTAGCRALAEAPLPTLAVLPTAAPDLTPQALDFWQVVDGELASTDQTDRWQFAARSGDPIRLSALGPVNLVVFAPDGRPLGTGPSVEMTLPAAGEYSVAVQLIEGQTGRYQLALTYTDRPNPADFTATPPPIIIGVPTPTPVFESALGLFIGTLANGETTAETFLRGPVQPHVYTFEGHAGNYLTIRMTRRSGTVDPALWLYGPAGDALAVDFNSGENGAALLRNIPLRQDGQFTLQADGGGLPGDYEIILIEGVQPVPVTPTIIAPPTATPFETRIDLPPMTAVPDAPLIPYIPVIGSLIRPGDVKRHTFNATAGDYVSIGVSKLQAESRLQPVVAVVDPLGQQIGSASARSANPGDDALIQLLPIAETGTYSIFVRGANGENGDYIIAFGKGTVYEDVPRGAAVADTPYDGQIARRGLRESWTVMLNAGDAITVAVSPMSDVLDPLVEGVAPDGSLVASDDNSGGYPNALINQMRAPVSGPYRIQVSASGGTSLGPYRLIWRYLDIAPTPTFDPPRILLFTVEDAVPEGQYVFYPFQGMAGERVRVRVTAQGGSRFDPVAALIGPDGSEIASGDDEDSLNPRFTADLLTDGTYQVRVNGYLTGGPFDLVVERLF